MRGLACPLSFNTLYLANETCSNDREEAQLVTGCCTEACGRNVTPWLRNAAGESPRTRAARQRRPLTYQTLIAIAPSDEAFALAFARPLVTAFVAIGSKCIALAF